MAIDEVAYNAGATCIGGNTGSTRLSNGAIDLKLDAPKHFGGGGLGAAICHLLLSACIIRAMKAVANREWINLPDEVAIYASVDIWPHRQAGRFRRRGRDEIKVRACTGRQPRSSSPPRTKFASTRTLRAAMS